MSLRAVSEKWSKVTDGPYFMTADIQTVLY